MSLISPASEKLIIEQEVSSEAIYRQKYTHATWPEGASGVTFGIGFDCGYSDEAGIEAAWAGRIPDQMVAIMMTAAHVTGERAHALKNTALMQTVIVPWEAAIDEFENVEVPKWVRDVTKAFPNADKLRPDSLGALVSLGYNRGLALHSADGRRTEMLNIHNLMAAGNFKAVPNEFRKMKRLWNNGLVARREAEARLFEKGLAAA